MLVGQKSKLPFARAYDFILADRALSAAEKLVMIEACRYWPESCFETAGTIARGIGLDSRYVRRLIKGLCQGPKRRQADGRPARRAYLRREYAQVQKHGTGDREMRQEPVSNQPGSRNRPGHSVPDRERGKLRHEDGRHPEQDPKGWRHP